MGVCCNKNENINHKSFQFEQENNYIEIKNSFHQSNINKFKLKKTKVKYKNIIKKIFRPHVSQNYYIII